MEIIVYKGRPITFLLKNLHILCTKALVKAGNHLVLMIGFTEFCAGIRTKHVRK